MFIINLIITIKYLTNIYTNEFGKMSQNAIFEITTFELAESLGLHSKTAP